MGVKVNVDTKALESAIKKQAKAVLQERSYEVECPHCGKKFDAESGINICPHCKNKVDLNLNIKF